MNEIGQTVSNGGITLTVTAAQVAQSIKLNDSGYRPGSAYEKILTRQLDLAQRS